MERIYYAGDRFLTGTDLARALVEYAAALARQGSAGAIEIPVRHADGTVGVVNFLVGPASQLATESIDGEAGEEIQDEQLVARLRHRVHGRELDGERAQPSAVEPEGTSGYDWTDEV